MRKQAVTIPHGSLGMKVIRDRPFTIKTAWLETMLYFRVLRNAIFRPFSRAVAPEARLFAKVFRANGKMENLGLIGTKMVTTAGVNFLVDALQGSVEPELLNYHASGTGGTSPVIGNITLETEVTDNARATGTQGENGANVYQTVNTISYTGAHVIVEHGILSAITGGTLLDRNTFAAINVASGDSIQFTYELTLPAGS